MISMNKNEITYQYFIPEFYLAERFGEHKLVLLLKCDDVVLKFESSYGKREDKEKMQHELEEIFDQTKTMDYTGQFDFWMGNLWEHFYKNGDKHESN